MSEQNNYSNLEILLELQALCIWKTGDHKGILKTKLSAIESRIALLLEREKTKRNAGVKVEVSDAFSDKEKAMLAEALWLYKGVNLASNRSSNELIDHDRLSTDQAKQAFKVANESEIELDETAALANKIG